MEDICNLLVYTSIPYRVKLDLDKSIKFGCEIEFEDANYFHIEKQLFNNKVLSKWELKDDATVRDYDNYYEYGGELISPILHDYKTCWVQLKKACNLIKQFGGTIMGRSAAHIHVDASILKDDIKYALNLIKLWTIYEHVIYRFSYGKENRERLLLPDYAAPVASHFINVVRDLEGMDLYIPIKKFYYFLFHVTSFYYMDTGISFLHCCNIEDKELNTIEIRCPNGTLDEIIWQNNVNFFIHLLSYCASNQFDEDFIKQKLKTFKLKKLNDYRNIYLEDAIELSNLIFEKEEDKLYFLKQYLKINENNKEEVIEKVKTR